MDKMLKTVTHPFVPYQVAFARREVMLTKHADEESGAPSTGRRCGLRFLDAVSSASRIRPGDWIVSRTPDEERHLWRIVEVTGTNDLQHIAVEPVGDPTQGLFVGGQGGEIEALYYRRLVPAKYYLDVLGLYLLNLLVANSPITVNDREKISASELAARAAGASTIAAVDPDSKTQPPGIIDAIIGLVHGSKNELQDVFAFVAHVYLKLTWHDSASSYSGAAAERGQDELDPTEFLLDVVNDAKPLRNKVEDFLSVPRNTFENRVADGAPTGKRHRERAAGLRDARVRAAGREAVDGRPAPMRSMRRVRDGVFACFRVREGRVELDFLIPGAD